MPIFVPNYRLTFVPGTWQRVSEVVFYALKRQAQRGLGVGKSGQLVTLHGPNTARLWQGVTVDDQGNIDFSSALAFLLAEYGADQVRPETMAEIESLVSPILNEGARLEEVG